MPYRFTRQELLAHIETLLASGDVAPLPTLLSGLQGAIIRVQSRDRHNGRPLFSRNAMITERFAAGQEREIRHRVRAELERLAAHLLANGGRA